MQSLRIIGLTLVVVSSALGMFGCDGGGDSQKPPPSTTVTLQGRVDDGTLNSPIANARCQVVDGRGSLLGASTRIPMASSRLVFLQAWRPLLAVTRQRSPIWSWRPL